jgi:hypothetical protein
MVHFGGHLITWETVKKDHFPKWSFGEYHKPEFQKLMRWFFQELHKEIAAQRNGTTPAKEEHLKKYGCWNLDINEIMPHVRKCILEKSKLALDTSETSSSDSDD